MTIREEIEQLKKEKNAVILAHYYVRPEVQEIADYVGDSFYLSKVAVGLKEKTIVFCGVSFMGESAKILNPEKTVLMPDMAADCPMAHMITIKEIKEMREKYDDLAVVCYINSTAEIKQYADVCVTSSNAIKIVKALPQKNIFFIPDQNLGDFVRRQVPEKNVMTLDKLNEVKQKYPEAKIAVHPECKREIVEAADFVGSTSAIIDYVVQTEAKDFIIGTVDGVFAKIKELAPNKNLHTIMDVQVCPNMKKVTLDKLIEALENEENEVLLSEQEISDAHAPLLRMLELAK